MDFHVDFSQKQVHNKQILIHLHVLFGKGTVPRIQHPAQVFKSQYQLFVVLFKLKLCVLKKPFVSNEVERDFFLNFLSECFRLAILLILILLCLFGHFLGGILLAKHLSILLAESEVVGVVGIRLFGKIVAF